MSIIVSNSVEISNSPLNSSKSKQLFSFPKAPRFAYLNPKEQCDKIYDLPPIKDKRATSMGYGTKYDFTKGGKNVPSPDTYNIRADPVKDAHAWSFGLSRELVKSSSIFGIPQKIPGPGSYTLNRSLEAPTFNFAKGGDRSIITKSSQKLPGPGTYDPVPSISPKGKYVLSNYHDSGAPSFNPPRSKRFGDRISKEGPGPGAYELQHGFDPKGNYFNSRMKNSLAQHFSSAERSTLQLPSKASPGPGSYRLPSDFGHYESKHAAETDRIDMSKSGTSPKDESKKEMKEAKKN